MALPESSPRSNTPAGNPVVSSNRHSIEFLLNPKPEEQLVYNPEESIQNHDDFFKTIMNENNIDPNPAEYLALFPGFKMYGSLLSEN